MQQHGIAHDDTIVIGRAVAERIVNNLVAVALAVRLARQPTGLRMGDDVRADCDQLVEALQASLADRMPATPAHDDGLRETLS